MNEEDYWPRLEYRVCHELEGMKEKTVQAYWCDGFIPLDYQFEAEQPSITGHAWICKGSEQMKWGFTLLLPRSMRSRDEIDWASLLPNENETRWLTLDRHTSRVEINPGANQVWTPDIHKPDMHK